MYYSKHQFDDTIVALATPAGVGAIAVIRLSGKDALQIADRFFYGKKLSRQASHTAHFGTIRADNQQIIDEVLATVFVAPRSYTRENTVEISTHGSPYIVQQVIQLAIRHGARMAQPGEFTLRAFLNGQLDLSQAEAVADLIASSSESAHQLAIQQMRGGFSLKIKELRNQLVNFASLMELELDFGEEDVEFANRSELKLLILKIQQVIRNLSDSFALGNVLKNGVLTVIAGRPNAGKSTLLNALLNEERAIVSEIAGTTRDTIEEILNINGIAFRLVDTAGIRQATDAIEAIGVQKTLEKVRQSAVLLYVFDLLETTTEEVKADLASLRQQDMKILVICNKVDSKEGFNRNDFAQTIQADNIIALSAKYGTNLKDLKSTLYELVSAGQVKSESTIVSNARHYEALQKSDECLSAVLNSMAIGVTTDFVAMDLRMALYHLGSIVGSVTTDDLLENIFRNFCIGK
jgi:tRNA modification GTPase